MQETIMKLIEENRYKEVRNEIAEMNIVDIAQLIMELDRTKLLILFRILPKEIAADVFSYVSLELQQYIIESITDKEISNIVNDLFIDDAVDFLEEMPSNVVKKVLRNTDEDTRKLINQFLNYPDYSAGSVMTIEFVDLKKEMIVKEALNHIRATGVDKETINTCYVIDKGRKLEGVLSIRKLILAEEDVIIGDIMNEDVIYANTLDDQETVADLFKKYDLTALPVVDNEHRLVGIVTIDDIIDIIDQENTEDLHKMAAMEPLEEEYLKTSPFILAKHRIVWLLVLMISATFTGIIIQKYEKLLQSMVILTSFIPMIMDTGGNAGSQASTLIIRGMALGEIKTSDMLKVFLKEFQVSILAGSVLAVVNFFRLVIFEHVNYLMALVVCFSLLCTVVLAKLVGGVLPMVAKKVHLDPAIMAGPLITTLVDVLALSIYFEIASKFLNL
ncbi:magnesium transporter [Lutispora thermophila]|uniref:Magnesium transporter MgtE n=1 Tax=Lutispora thermophila DSM 19022 TaxID=1122184 RepID=A0A1M6B7P8_9FIRM|nr:magnesium transporter [Lutispora thermophila]SHI44761.1 magnesium transporter [Lutispora thermophila DSM 19022]